MATIILLGLFVLMWFVLIVPRQRELRRHQALLRTLAVGDEVMTSSGIYGTIREIGDDHVSIEVAPGLQLRFARRAVASKVPDTGQAASTHDALEAAFEDQPQDEPADGEPEDRAPGDDEDEDKGKG